MSANNVDTICPLSPLQHGMLHAAQQAPASGLYVEQFSCVLVGTLDVDAFHAAWQSVVDRHDVLKTLFLRLDTARPVQVVRKSVVLPFVVDDWTADGEFASDESARFAALLADDRRAGFDPAIAPLMRVRLVRTAADRHRFLWTYHHAILDGWSMPVLLREVFDHLANPARVVPPRRADYRHYLAWLARQDVDRSLEFWRERLRGFRVPTRFAPSIVPRESDPAAPRRFATRRTALSPAWADAATARCRASRITLNTLCQAAWALLLAHYGDTDDVVHGLVVSGRTADVPDIERMAGLFIGTLPARATLDRECRASDWLRRLQADTQQLERHAATPLARVLSCADVPRSQALFDTLYVFENYPGQSAFEALVESRGLRVEDVHAVEETGYGLVLIVLPVDGLKLQLTYDTSKFSTPAIEELLASYQRLLDRLLAIGDAPLGTTFACLVDESPSSATSSSEHLIASEMSTRAAAAPGEAPLLIAGDTAVDPPSFTRAIARARATWARLGARVGDRFLLVAGAQPHADLVAMMAGAASGLEIVVAAPTDSRDQAHAHAIDAFGATATWRCVVAMSDPHAEVPAGSTLCERFALDDDASNDMAAIDAAAEPGGAITWLVRSPQRETLAVRHAFSDLAALAQAAEQAVARVAISAFSGSPIVLAALLRAMRAGTGVSLSPAAHSPSALASWLHVLSTAKAPWGEVHLDPTQTRALAASFDVLAKLGDLPRIETACWVVDARSLTTRGAWALAQLAPRAQVRRVLDDGLAGGIIATATCEGRLHVEGGPGLLVVGAGGDAVAPHALGRLAVGGAVVPEAIWRRGRPDRLRRVVTKAGPLLLLPMVAWRVEDGAATTLPDRGAALRGDPVIDVLEPGLAHVEGVRELAVAAWLDDDGEWGVRIHVVADDGADGEAVVSRLHAAVEAHDVLAASIERLARLPRDTAGRIDRIALDRGDVERPRGDTLVAPRDETESALHAIWCSLLQREGIGIHDDYFDLGGDSLLATVMLAQVQAATGSVVEIDALLQAPTIAGLARTLREGARPDDDIATTLSRDAAQALRIALPESPESPAGATTPRAPENVLLTGATGFLGVHLLAELLATTTARVHCLVRAADGQAGRARLVQALQAHGLWDATHAARIVAIPGDLGPARFGLSPEAFDALAREIDAIHHNGAAVNFVLPYAKLKPVNIDATDEVLRLASLHRVKQVHYVSTVGVLDRAADMLPETLGVPLHGRLMGGYEQSKWVAEQRVRIAGERGLPVTIYRPSRIVGHSRTGRVNVDDLFCRLIRGVVMQGQAPYSTGYDNMLPVDLVARLVVEASLHPDVAGGAVHVVNPRAHTFDSLIDFIASRGHAIDRLPYGDWLAAVATSAKARTDHPLAPLLPVLRLLDASKDPTLARAMPLGHANLARFAPVAFAAIGPAEQWLPVMFEHLYANATLPRPVVEQHG